MRGQDTAPDIYETPDLPPTSGYELDSDSDSEYPGHHKSHTASTDVIQEGTDPSAARAKFKGSRLNGAGMSFSLCCLKLTVYRFLHVAQEETSSALPYVITRDFGL